MLGSAQARAKLGPGYPERGGPNKASAKLNLKFKLGPARSCNGHRPVDRWGRSYLRAAVAPAMGSLREANFTKRSNANRRSVLL
jgi:hypothetical protein